MSWLAVAGLAAVGYFVYRALSMSYGDPLETASGKYVNQNYYTRDASYMEQHLQVNPTGVLTVYTVDPGQLYDIDCGSGVRYQVDVNGLQSLLDQYPADRVDMK